MVVLQNSTSCFWTRWNKEGQMRRLTTSSSVMHKVFSLDTKLKCKLYIFITSFFNVKCTVANNLLDRSGLIILENGTKICFVKKTSLSLETKHVAHKLYNLFKFLWKNGMYWIIFLGWSSVYSRYTRNKVYLRHRVLLLVDII